MSMIHDSQLFFNPHTIQAELRKRKQMRKKLCLRYSISLFPEVNKIGRAFFFLLSLAICPEIWSSSFEQENIIIFKRVCCVLLRRKI